MHFSRQNQKSLLDLTLRSTNGTGWSTEAIAFGISRDPDTGMIGVMAFDGFRGHDAELSIAMFNGAPLTKSIIGSIIGIAFHPKALGLHRLWVRIATDDTRALSAAIRCGFEVEYRMRGGYAGGKDAILLSMNRPQPGQAPARPHDERAAALDEV